ncbi:MAG TPA: flagellar biosynthetic protein FliR [Miltoncostaeaceae bacterium]|jgi:flagellar biosynthesis protein FliR|nr:flagellar biosynthetic protein FliR [Miltoncostaeaceae bacterium]
MDELFRMLQADALLFGLMLMRVGAMFAIAPVLGARVVPLRLRVGLGVVVALSALPMVAEQTGPLPDSAFAYVLLGAKEVVLGAVIGLVAQMIFAAVQLAGSFVDVGAGFAIASTIDPVNNTNLTVLGRAYNMIATAAFIAIGGHLFLMQAVVSSFTLAPPDAFPRFGVLVQGVLVRSDELFVIALQLAAPLMAALLITDVALGIMSRAAPQMNVFIVGLPVKVGLALVGTAVLLPSFVTFLNGVTQQMLLDLSTILTGAGTG